jgi:hypothetical protein
MQEMARGVQPFLFDPQDLKKVVLRVDYLK